MEHGQTIPHPDTALIRANNARSIARRASVSALAQSVSRTSFASLTRRPKRQVTGGRFREIQAIPDPIKAPTSQIPDDLINQFFSQLNFQTSELIVPRQNFLGGVNFGGGFAGFSTSSRPISRF